MIRDAEDFAQALADLGIAREATVVGLEEGPRSDRVEAVIAPAGPGRDAEAARPRAGGAALLIFVPGQPTEASSPRGATRSGRWSTSSRSIATAADAGGARASPARPTTARAPSRARCSSDAGATG